MIQNKHKFAFLLCMLLMTTTVFGASEAEYKKLAKTWTLNADGSQEFRYDMELTLFTHTVSMLKSDFSTFISRSANSLR